ncbi:MAG TPA: DMT family transporter, partial [Actinomycetota bacterium]|nr:DMT family transporter [Actinomycetota bacterium]
MRSRTQAGYLELVLLGVLWGSIGVIIEPIRVGAAGIALVRTATGCLLALAYMLLRRRVARLRLRRSAWLLIADGVLLAVHWTLMFEAFKRLSVGTAILLVFIGPVLVAVGAWPLLRERVETRTIGALAVSLGGMALIAIPAWEVQDPAGVVYALLSAVAFAMVVLANKRLTAIYEPATILVWQLGVAALAVAPVALTGTLDGFGEALPRLLMLGALHTAAAGFIYFAAVRVVKVQHVGVLTYLEPATAIAYAWIFLS